MNEQESQVTRKALEFIDAMFKEMRKANPTVTYLEAEGAILRILVNSLQFYEQYDQQTSASGNHQVEETDGSRPGHIQKQGKSRRPYKNKKGVRKEPRIAQEGNRE